MNTTEYKQKSSEALGLKIVTDDIKILEGLYVYIDGVVTKWHPDIDANQREMIEDWLVEQGLRLQYIWNKREWDISIYSAQFDSLQTDKSKSIAFGKAFLEYLKAA